MSGDPPGDEARALFEAARAEVERAIPADAVERMRGRLARSLGGAPAPLATAAAASGWRAVAAHVAVGVASFASGYAVRAASERATVRVEVRDRTVFVPAPVAPRAPEAPSADDAPAARGDAGAPARGRSSTNDDGASLASEQWWIDRASAGLRAGRAAEALRSAEEHARRYPRGQLGGIREVLRAEALSSLGRVGEARALARGALRRERSPGMRARLGAVLGDGGVQ